MLRTRRAAGSAAVLAVAGLVLTACGGSSSSSSPPNPNNTSSSSGANFSLISADNTGTPQRGGVLKVAGSGDADYLDPNVSYSSLGYTASRLYSRQLYTYSSQLGHTTDVVPDLATGAPVVSNGGKTLTITIRQGADWNTTPKRQVTAADFQRGVDITCNPTSIAFGGQGDFSSLIKGYPQFCAAFAKAKPTVAGIKSFLQTHSISGIKVGSTPETVVINLTQPAGFFEDELSLTALSPRPVEMLNYLPGSAQEEQHTVSDGPYEIKSYNPTHSIDFVRNPAWDPSTDPVRHAYVNEITVTEGEQQDAVQQQILAGSLNTDWDIGPSATQTNQLIDQGNKQLNVQSEEGSNPYIVFNTASPNNNGALKNVVVRQALSYAINRANLIQDAGGQRLEVPLTHVLPPQIDGAPTSTSTIYPYNQAKAKSMLQQAGFKNLTLKFLYRPVSSTSQKMFEDVQAQLQKIGIHVVGVGAPGQFTIYTKYLEHADVARNGAWDMALIGWGPDWYGNAALSFFRPLFYGKVLPPASSDYGLYNDPKVNSLTDQAAAAQSLSKSNALWTEADNQVMKDAAFYPIGDPNWPLLHSTNTHNDIYMPAFQNFDYANIWVS